MNVGELKEYLTEFPDEAKFVVVQPDGTKAEATAVEINSEYEVSIS